MTYELESVTIRRGQQVVLQDISLKLACGSLIGIIGPNGAGKSTLLGALAGDLVPERGALVMHGIHLTQSGHRELARQRAVMSQQAEAIFNLSVRQVLELGLFAFDHWSGTKRDELLRQVCQVTGVHQWLDQAMTARSMGEQQRVHFTRALLQAKAALIESGAAWLLLDEPTANQDPAHQQAMMAACRELLGMGEVGVLAVMHDLSLAAQWCDHLIVIKQGRVLTEGPVRAVMTPEGLKETYGKSLGVHVQESPGGVIVYTPRP
jgi:iron complex transport system ATP-binding protein